MNPIAAVFCTLAVATPCLLAQSPIQPQLKVPPGYDWPPELGTGSFGRAEAAQITEDLVPDLVLLRGPHESPPAANDLPVMVYGPSVYRALCPLPLAVTDFAVVPGIGPSGRDAIALCTAAGVALATVADGDDEFTLALLGVGGFAAARRLRAIDLDGDFDCDLVALAADGSSLVTALWTATGFVAGPSFTLSHAATEFTLPVPGDADGMHLAILNSLGLLFVDATLGPPAGFVGTPRQYRSIAPGDALFAIREPPAPDTPRKVVWITEASTPGNQVLLVIDSVAYEPMPFVLGELDARVVVCADLDSDGDDEALVTRASESGVLAFVSHAFESGTAFPNGMGNGVELLPAGATATAEPDQRAWPVVRDLDNDDDDDLFIALQSSLRLGFIDGADLPGDSQSLVTGSDLPTLSGSSWTNVGGEQTPALPGRLHASVTVDGELSIDHKLQLVVWRQEAYGATIAPDAVYWTREDVHGLDYVELELEVHDVGAYVGFPVVFWWELRYIRLTPGTSHLEETFPARMYAFTTTNSNGQSTTLTQLQATASGPTVLTTFFPGSGGGGGNPGVLPGGVLCGGFVPQAEVPFFFTGGGIPRPNP